MRFMMIVKATIDSEAGVMSSEKLTAGYGLIQVRSREEAIEWAARAPDPHGHGEGQIEVRQVFDAPELTQEPELPARDAKLRVQVETQLQG